MKGNDQLIETLNRLLSEELTAINQYILHGEMCGNWGYEKLHEGFEKRSIAEMKHAEKLIERILFLEGRPSVSDYRPMNIGSDVPAMVNNDLGLEYGAVQEYNDAIKQAGEVGDFATREILVEILEDEDGHVDELENLKDQIEQLGLQLFLSTQL